MDHVLFQYDQSFVLEAFRQGDFDFVDGVSEVEETQFFRYIGAHKILAKLAETYPSPRKKHDVPLWMYIASNLTMRLHGVHSFHAYPYVVRCGGMLNAFGPKVAHKAIHPETGDVTLHLSCTMHMAQPPTERERRVMYTGFALPPRDPAAAAAANRRLLLASRERAPLTTSQSATPY